MLLVVLVGVFIVFYASYWILKKNTDFSFVDCILASA